jgi:RNA polymerase sigma factor (sigma-70 family)
MRTRCTIPHCRVSYAKRYQYFGIPMDDLIQEGMIGVMLAARNYDPSHGKAFLNYAKFWVKRGMYNICQKYQWPITMHTIGGKRSDIKMGVSNIEYEDMPYDVHQNDNYDHVMYLMKSLTDRESNVIKWYYGIDCEPKDQNGIAKDLGVTRQMVSLILKKAMQKMADAEPK